jgi:hypothetical protein
VAGARRRATAGEWEVGQSKVREGAANPKHKRQLVTYLLRNMRRCAAPQCCCVLGGGGGSGGGGYSAALCGGLAAVSIRSGPAPLHGTSAGSAARARAGAESRSRAPLRCTPLPHKARAFGQLACGGSNAHVNDVAVRRPQAAERRNSLRC